MDLFIKVLFIVALFESYSSNQLVNQILLISFDGLSSVYFEEFLKEYPKSNFQEFINEGLRAEFLKPSFPTSTFPNHYTLGISVLYYIMY